MSLQTISPLTALPPQLQTEQNPDITCALAGAPAWCATYNPKLTDSGQGFLTRRRTSGKSRSGHDSADARAGTSNLILDHVSPKISPGPLAFSTNSSATQASRSYLGTRSLSLPVQRRLNPFQRFIRARYWAAISLRCQLTSMRLMSRQWLQLGGHPGKL